MNKEQRNVPSSTGTRPGRQPYATPRLTELGNLARLVEAMGASQVEGASGMVGMPDMTAASPFGEEL